MKTDAFCVELHRVEFLRAPVSVHAAFDLALHTGEPVGDDQSSNEVDLAGYGRVVVMRSEQQWVVLGRKVLNAELVRFPTVKTGKVDATHLSIGIDGKIRRIVRLSEPVTLSANRRVEFEPGTIEVVEKEGV